eukprot:443791-Alexandrium_andersonii.AAC.1
MEDGTFADIASRTGTQQGDPLGPFYLSAPLHKALQGVHAAHPDVVLLAYMDDIHALGPADAVVAALAALEVAMAAINLRLTLP